jgi:quercetin dioxygenase-like cupin family protein
MNEQPLIKSSAAGVLSLPAETQFAGNGIVSRTILRTPVTRVALFGFAEGQELTEHSSSYEALVQILSGECEFALDGKVRHLKSGDLVFMPPRLPHSLKATSQFSMLLTLSKPDSTPSKQEQPATTACALA